MDPDAVEEAALPYYRTHTSMSLEAEAAVGRIAIWAAWLEITLADFCTVLIDARSGVGTTLTDGMTGSQMIQMSKKLSLSPYSRLSPELQQRIVRVLAGAKQALEQRNKILHASVGGSLIPDSTAFYSRRRNAQGQMEAAIHTPEELDAMGAQLHAAMEEVWDCSGEVTDALRRHQGRSRHM